jgi:hypothetical protein
MNLTRIATSLAVVASLNSCGDPPPRDPDPWEEDWASGARDGSTGQGLNVRVDVQTYEIDEADEEGWEAFWAAAIPIGGGELSINGLTAGTGGPRFFASLDAWQRRSSVRRKTDSFIVTSDGVPGSIEVSEARAEPVTVLLWAGGQVVETWRWSKAGAFLEVVPERLGDKQVRVRVRPVVSHREGGGTTAIRQLETMVTVKEGEAVVIGGSSRAEEQSVGGTFFYRWSGRRRQRVVFVLRARGW